MALEGKLMDLRHEQDKYIAKVKENQQKVKHFNNQVKRRAEGWVGGGMTADHFLSSLSLLPSSPSSSLLSPLHLLPLLSSLLPFLSSLLSPPLFSLSSPLLPLFSLSFPLFSLLFSLSPPLFSLSSPLLPLLPLLPSSTSPPLFYLSSPLLPLLPSSTSPPLFYLSSSLLPFLSSLLSPLFSLSSTLHPSSLSVCMCACASMHVCPTDGQTPPEDSS